MAVISLLFISLSIRPSSLGYDMSLAIFGGSIVGLIISSVDYRSERHKAMEDFFIKGRAAHKALYRIWLFDVREPQAEFIKWLEKPYEEDIDKGVLANYQEQKDRLLTHMGYCIQVSDSLQDYKIGDAYANLDFLFANQSVRRRLAYEKILSFCQEARAKIENVPQEHPCATFTNAHLLIWITKLPRIREYFQGDAFQQKLEEMEKALYPDFYKKMYGRKANYLS